MPELKSVSARAGKDLSMFLLVGRKPLSRLVSTVCVKILSFLNIPIDDISHILGGFFMLHLLMAT